MVFDRASLGADGNGSPTTGGVPPLRIVIVDDHALLRTGTRQILSEAEGMEVVAEAADAAQALEAVERTQPDIVLIDIRLPDRNGIDVARLIIERNPSIRVVILSAYDDEDYVRAAIDSGVAGYLLKTMPGDELVTRRACVDCHDRARLGGNGDPRPRAPRLRSATERDFLVSHMARAGSRGPGRGGTLEQDDRYAPKHQRPHCRRTSRPRIR